MGTLKSPRHLAPTVGGVRRWLDLQVSGLCSSSATANEKMKEGSLTPTPHVMAPARQRPRCGGARQQRLLCVATATPQSRRGGAQADAPLGAAAPTSTQGFLSSNGHASSAAAWRRLKTFSQHGAWSQRPSRRKLAVSSCRLHYHPRCLVLLQTGPRHQARGPLALAPRTSWRRTDLLHAPCSSI